MTRARFLALPALLLCLAAPAAAELKPIVTVEGITEYRLDNGLQVLLFPDQSKATVTVNVTYLVGSRHEGRGERGMAHLLEHMVFKGTPTTDNIWGALQDHGATFNGTTWVDRTNYYETLPASDENLDFALRMEADRMVNSRIAAEDLETEMTVVRNEFEMGENDPVGILWERLVSTAYLWHNYGLSTIGNRSDIERVPVENLRRFYEKHYQPDNAMLVVAGKFEPPKALSIIEESFGRIPRPQRRLDDTWTEEPAQDGARFVTLNRVGSVQAAGAVYHICAGSHADFAAFEVLSDILVNEPSGRLYQALVPTALAYNLSGFAFPWREPGLLILLATSRLDQDVQRAHDTMLEVTEGLGAGPITAEEVDRARTRLLKNIKLALTNSGGIGIELSEWAALGDWRMFFIHRDRLKEVTPEDVQRVARAYLVESNRTSGLFVPVDEPVRATVPATPDVTEIVRGYRGSETIDEGEAFVATPQSIEARVKRSTLPGGMKTALLAKETRGNAVSASFIFRYGTEQTLSGHTTALDMIPTMLMRGTKRLDYARLRDEMDRLQSRISLGAGGPGTLTAAIVSDRDNLVPAIELLGEILRTPSFPADEFAIVQKEQLATLESGLTDPQARLFTTLTRAMSPYPQSSVHYVPTIEEEIERVKAVTTDEVKRVYQRFYGASNMDVSIVGDFAEADVTTTLERVFSSWKSPGPCERVVRPWAEVAALDETIDTPDKEMAVVASGARFRMRDDDADYAALELANFVLGASPKSRLLTSLRHEGGLSYGAGSFLQVDPRSDAATVVGYAICAPQNASLAQETMAAEIGRWIREGLTQAEIEDGRLGYGKRFENMITSDRTLSMMLSSDLDLGRTMQFKADLLKRIGSVSAEEIRAALGKHLGEAAMVQLKAGDFTARPGGEAAQAGGGTPGDKP